MSDVIEVKGKKAKNFVERILPSDILEARKLTMTRRRVEEAFKSRLKTVLFTILDSSGDLDLIPLPDEENIEKFTNILESLPEEDAKSIMYNVPLDTLDELIKFTENKRPDVSTRLLKLMRKYRKSKWIPNPEVF
jgi:hypothetical protein